MPVFIIGSARSGTELMVQILNRHPQVMIAAETHYSDDLRPRIRPAAREFPDPRSRAMAETYFAKLRGGAYGLHGTEHAQSPPATVAADTSDIRWIDAMFQQHCLGQAQQRGKDMNDLRVWGEKTPRHVFCLSDISVAFPKARFIFMQRDPRAVIASYRDWQNHFIASENAGPALRKALAAEDWRVKRSFSIGIASLMWRAAQKTAWRGQERLGPERLRIQKFEDLLAEPQQQIAQICAFLGIDPCAEMQTVGRINSSYGHATDAGIDASAATAWQGRLADRESWIIEKLCFGPMAAGGYAPMARRPHPGALAVEIARSCARIPLAFVANRRRMGSPFVWVLRRLGIGN
ncbi:MAG: sulfotransferase [Rhodobacteraceae bacterium]|nr:sulfotransferase [Paracoccaceae bacterium]